MKKEILFCLVGIFLVVLCLHFINAAEDMTQGSDWKWSYAQTYVEDSLSKLSINNEDIAFAKMKVASANKDCENIGGSDAKDQWCIWAQEDNATLERMLKAQASQSTTSQENTSKGIWDKIKDFFKNLFG